MANPTSSQLGGLYEQLGSFQLGAIGFAPSGGSTDISLSVTPAISFVVGYTANAALALSVAPAFATSPLNSFDEALGLNVTPGLTLSNAYQVNGTLDLAVTPNFAIPLTYDETLGLSVAPAITFAQLTQACVDFPSADSCAVDSPQAIDECGCLVDPF